MLQKGESVVDNQTNQLGTVSEVFADGRTAVFFQDDTTRYYIRVYLMQISRQVECLRNYCGGTRVIDFGGEEGTIRSLFENGVAFVLFPSNTSRLYVRKIEFELKLAFNELRSLHGIRVGDTVIDDADNSIGTVKFIYSNGYYRILFHSDSSRYYDRTFEQITPALKN